MAIGGRVKRKEDAFYGLLKEFANDIAACGDVYVRVVNEFPHDAEALVAQVKEREVACDDHLRNSLRTLAESFITPFDREDINELVHAMDEVPDLMEDVSARFLLFRVTEMRPEAKEVAGITVRATNKLRELFEHLPQYRNDQTVLDCIVEIKRLEDEGDVSYRQGLARLFEPGADPIETQKWKALLDGMEGVLDAVCEVANVVQGVLMKNA